MLLPSLYSATLPLFSFLIVPKICRWHFLQCPSTLLSKNFEKLIQCDQRLNQLSLQPDIILDSPVFEPRCSIFEDPVESKCTSFANLKDEHETLPVYSGSMSPHAGSSMSANNEANDSIGMAAEFLPPTAGNSKLMIAFHCSSPMHSCISHCSVLCPYIRNSSLLPLCGAALHVYALNSCTVSTCFGSMVSRSQPCITGINYVDVCSNPPVI